MKQNSKFKVGDRVRIIVKSSYLFGVETTVNHVDFFDDNTCYLLDTTIDMPKMWDGWYFGHELELVERNK